MLRQLFAGIQRIYRERYSTEKNFIPFGLSRFLIPRTFPEPAALTDFLTVVHQGQHAQECSGYLFYSHRLAGPETEPNLRQVLSGVLKAIIVLRSIKLCCQHEYVIRLAT